MLENEFSKFGDIMDAIIMKNNETGQSRGFGFVTYRDPKAATMAANTINKVDGKTVCFNFLLCFLLLFTIHDKNEN